MAGNYVVDIAQFAGPIGGILSLTWGAGAMMGYVFAEKTIGKRVADLRADMVADRAKCAEDIHDLTTRLREIEDRAYHGMERQAGQVRQSAAYILDRGQIIAQRPEDEGKL